MHSVLPSPAFGHDHRFGRQSEVHSFPMPPVDPTFYYGRPGHLSFPPALQAPSFVDPAFMSVPADVYPHAGAYHAHYVPGLPPMPSHPLDFEPASMQPQGAPIPYHHPEFHHPPPQLRLDMPKLVRDITPSPPSSSSSTPRSAVFSRRSDGFIAGAHAPARSSNLAGAGGNDPAFCRISSAAVRQRTAQACEKCRDRKTKCTGMRPTCKRCEDRGLTCEWAPETRVRGQQKFPKQSGRLSPSDNEGGPVDALPHGFSSPVDTTHSSPVNNGVPFAAVSNTESGTAPSRRRHGASASMDSPHVKAVTNAAAQRMSWPMGPPATSMSVDFSSIRKASSLELLADFPSTVGADDDRWDCEWTESKPWEDATQDTAAPVPARHFDFDAFIKCFAQNGVNDSGDASPQSAPGLDSSVSLSAVEEGLDADILNLLNHDSFGSSPASSWASPVSPTTQLDVPQDILVLSGDKPTGLDADLTPTIRTNEADIMAQYLNDDFFGMADH